MPTVVGVKFHEGGAIHFYSPGDLLLSKDDPVVVETHAGPRLGSVVLGPREMSTDQAPGVMRPVSRIATEEDIRRDSFNRGLVQRTMEVAQDCIRALNLPMRLIDVDPQYDGTRVTVFFAAEGRVDFRELVREMTQTLNVRVMMHQVGARDHAKMLGGIGSCGRELCCASWMEAFEPVSMRMAKEQSLFLNPSKFSGSCGKLKCCLRYEYDFYAEAHDVAPAVGEFYDTPNGRGRVVDINVVKQTFSVFVPGEGQVEIRLRLRTTPAPCPHDADTDAPPSED